MACGDGQRCQVRWNCGGVALSREIEMKKLAIALLLFTAPALAQTPNLAGAPPASTVESPVVCLPIGKTSKGDLVYAMECRDIPVEKTALGYETSYETSFGLMLAIGFDGSSKSVFKRKPAPDLILPLGEIAYG